MNSLINGVRVLVNVVINLYTGLIQAIYYLGKSYEVFNIWSAFLPSIVIGYITLTILITVIYFIIGRQG